MGSTNKSQEQFLKECDDIHGNIYDYSETVYEKSNKEVCIICHKNDENGIEHGKFWQKPNKHLLGQGCPVCAREKHRLELSSNNMEFIGTSVKIHGDDYKYTKVIYKNRHTKVCIICNKCGCEFYQTPQHHINGGRCSKCNPNIITTESFIDRSNIIQYNKYDYSITEYININKPVCIICPKHGEFWQKPKYHLEGKGCPHCKESKLEKEIRCFLLENNIIFEREKKFYWLKNKNGKYLFLDFYLPEHNIAIECQGEQHFKPYKYFGGNNGFDIIHKRDELKYNLCNDNNIKLVYYTKYHNTPINYFSKIYSDKNELLKEILQ